MPDNPVTSQGALGAAKHADNADNADIMHAEHPPYLRHHFNSTEQQGDAASFAMWLFLLTEVMFFGGLSLPT
jgi:cytochrome c oxidase subunit 3